MQKSSLVLQAMSQAVFDSKVFSHMRKIAYAPVILSNNQSAAEVLLAQTKAQEKRARKQMKRASQLSTINKGV